MINNLNNLLWDSSECREYKLHFFFFFCCCFAFFIVYSSFFPSPIWHSSCLTDIGAHKLWLLAPFAMCAYLMYYISSDINNDEYCVYDLMYLCIYYMAIKFFHCHHCHCHCQTWCGHCTYLGLGAFSVLVQPNNRQMSVDFEKQCKFPLVTWVNNTLQYTHNSVQVRSPPVIICISQTCRQQQQPFGHAPVKVSSCYHQWWMQYNWWNIPAGDFLL